MSDQTSHAQTFAALHVKGDPIIIYNAWDGGSARAIEAAGAKAIAVGDHPVGFAHGYTNDDFDSFSFDSYLGTIKDIVRVLQVPFSVDISNGDGLDQDGITARVRDLLDLGVVGINFEDRDYDGGIRTAEAQSELIRAIRSTADQAGVPLFINARTDIFITSGDPAEHAGLFDEAISRAEAYKAAGANGFFAPGLVDLELIGRICDAAPLPVNIIKIPDTPEIAELRAAGVSRISYGPVVQMQMIAWLTAQAQAVFNQ